MKKSKDIIKFINQARKKNNYKWEKEGQEILSKINSNNYDKSELKSILSILFLTEDIPNDFIPKLWLTSTKIEEKIKSNKDQYKKLIKAYDILIKNEHPLYLFLENKIGMDLNRSFDKKKVVYTDDNINQLKNILHAFTVRNVSLNYCQGYNTITALLLSMTKFKEEESYYLFQILMEEIIPYDYYLLGIGIEAETTIINKLLEKYEPDILTYFNTKEGADLILYGLISQFITSLFTFKMDSNITLFFYNIIFGFYSLEKNKKDIFFYFYKIILAIFKTLKPELLKCKKDEQLNDIINFEKLNKDKIQSIFYYTLYDESKNGFDIEYAAKIRKECIDNVVKRKTLKFKYENKKGLKCNINYPVCLEEYNMESKFYLSPYHSKGIDTNKNNINNIIINDEDDESILKDIIIERRKHFCQIKSIKTKYNYTWEKEGKEIIEKINNDNNYNKSEYKDILSTLFLKEAIPNNMIPSLWKSCTKLSEIINKNKGQYPKYIKAFNILIKNKHPFYLYIEEKIAKDLNRTFAEYKVSSDEIYKLKNILQAFCVRNSSINYCQGLNGIVSRLLIMMNFEEEECFYLFLIMLENILPYDYYLFGIGVEAELNIINKLLDKYEPELMKYLYDLNGISIVYGIIMKFVTSVFTFKVGINLTNILYNIFFGFYLIEEKQENLFFYFYKIILAIFKVYKDDIFRCKDLKSINELFNFEKEISKDYIERIIYYTLFESKTDFDINEVKIIRQNEVNKIIEKRETKFNFTNEKNIKCNLNYPLCIEEYNHPSPIELQVTYKNNRDKDEEKEEEEEDINNNIKIDNEISGDGILKDIIVERRKHYCQNK